MLNWTYFDNSQKDKSFECFLNEQAVVDEEQTGRHQVKFAAYDNKEFVIKRYSPLDKKSWFRRLDLALKNLVTPDAKRSYQGCVLVYESGVPTMKPVAWAHRGVGLNCESYFVYEAIEAQAGVHDLLGQENLSPDLKRELIVKMGKISRQLHDAGLRHTDIVPHNFLAQKRSDGGFELYLIDTDKVSKVKGLTRLPRLKAFFDWHCLRRLRLREPELKVFFSAYLGRTPAEEDVSAWYFWLAGGLNLYRQLKKRLGRDAYMCSLDLSLIRG